MNYGKKIKISSERALLDESRINGRLINAKSNGFLLEAEGGMSYIEKCKRNPDLPLWLTGVIQSGDKPNRNGRIYPWEYLKRECIRYMENEVRNGLSYGECFSEGHKILTKGNGWVDFKDLKDEEIVATMNPATKEFEWQQILRKVQYEHEGEMVSLKSNSIDTLVTPNHNFYIQYTYNKNKFDTISAKDLKTSHNIPTKSVWKGSLLENIVIENKFGKLELPVQEYCQFMGWYISEGWFAFNEKTGNYHVNIGQSKLKEKEEIQQILTKLGLKFNITERTKRKTTEYIFNICNKTLAFYVKDFGKSFDKYIPQIIKDLPSEYIQEFLDAYLKGDGWGSKKHKEYGTVSLKLAEDLLEVFQKTNKYGKIKTKKQYATYYVVENLETNEQKEILDFIYYTNKEYTDFKDNYKIVETRREFTGKDIYIISQKEKNTISIADVKKTNEFYKGKVYCVEVPNHIIYVSNNGIPFWSKNCDHPESSATPSLNNAALVIEDLSFKGKDVVAKIRVLNAYMPDNAPGRKIRGFLLNGKSVGISSRALGSLEQYSESEYDIVAEDMEMVCWDFVSNASNFGSEKMQLIESNGSTSMLHKKSKLLFESEVPKIQTLTESEKVYLEILGLEKFIKTRNILS